MSANTPCLRLTLAQRVEQPEFAQHALQAINGLRGASDPCDLLQRFRRACTALGSHGGLYIQAVPETEDRWLHLALLACEPRLATAIRNCRSLQAHRWVRHAARQGDTVLLSDLADSEVRTDGAALLLRDHGFRSGLLVPTHGGTQTARFGLLCLGSPIAGDFENPAARPVFVLAQAMALELNAWWLAYTRCELRRSARLRSDDLQLLALERDGLSSKEIARVTGSSSASVDSRFQRIGAKLGCPSRKAAAAKAAAHGLLECLP